MGAFDKLMSNPFFGAGMGILQGQTPSRTRPNFAANAMGGLQNAMANRDNIAQLAQRKQQEERLQDEWEMKKAIYDRQHAALSRRLSQYNPPVSALPKQGMPTSPAETGIGMAPGMASIENLAPISPPPPAPSTNGSLPQFPTNQPTSPIDEMIQNHRMIMNSTQDYKQYTDSSNQMRQLMQLKLQGQSKLGTTPQYVLMDDGSYRIMQLSSTGEAVLANLPDGVERVIRPVQTINTGGEITLIDDLTGQPISDPLPITPSPDQQPDVITAAVDAEAEAKVNAEIRNATRVATSESLAEAQTDLDDRISMLPNLERMVDDLSTLGKTATYTYAGQALDTVKRQFGQDVGEGAVARREYVSKVDNEILPLMKQTFGAQFSEKEGESLRATLGDVNASPSEKEAVLRSFMAAKRGEIETLKLRIASDIPVGLDIDPQLWAVMTHEKRLQYIEAGEE